MSKCIEYKGAINSNGYGTITLRRRSWLVSRLVYRIFKGKYPLRKIVCHSCDNRACINPDHLWKGTHKDNMQDAKSKNRLVIPKGSHNGQSKLSETDVLIIRRLYKEGMMSTIGIAKKFRISTRNVYSVINKETWAHL